jgi:hypothetical protein
MYDEIREARQLDVHLVTVANRQLGCFYGCAGDTMMVMYDVFRHSTSHSVWGPLRTLDSVVDHLQYQIGYIRSFMFIGIKLQLFRL